LQEYQPVTNFKFHDPVFDQHLQNSKSDNHENILYFLMHLALSHTILIHEEEDSKAGKPVDTYSA
jgi:hypothetical protein